MNDIQIVVFSITALSGICTLIKILANKNGWWNVAPFSLGFTCALWVAYIFG
jgi:hypothetical protein